MLGRRVQHGHRERGGPVQGEGRLSAHRALALATTIGALAGLASPVRAGIGDTPLPAFSDGKQARVAALIPAALKDNEVDTDILCTNLDNVPVDIGIELFDETGVARNSVAAGEGAFLDVAAGATVTAGTGATVVMHEDKVIALNGAGSSVNKLRNGSARVVAAGGRVGCVAFAVDRFHDIQDPVSCPTCRPPSMASLVVSAACAPERCDDGNPCTVDGCDAGGGCVHTPGADGTACDDGDVCTTADVCTGGVCAGTPLVCGADTPCFETAVCDPATGGCVDAPRFSTCAPGGGEGAADCAAEWVVDNPRNPGGVTSNVHVCRQGDRDCDFDIKHGSCTFHVRVCLNDHDVNLPACQPGQLASYELRHPAPRSRAARVLLDAVGALAPSSRGGKGRGRVTFAPPDPVADHCTPTLAVRVPLRRSLVLKVESRTAAGAVDRDRLRLRCIRPPRPRKP